MQKINVEKKKLLKIIKKLEKASDEFCNLICYLDPCLLDEDEVQIRKIDKSLGYCQSKLDSIVCHSDENNS